MPCERGASIVSSFWKPLLGCAVVGPGPELRLSPGAPRGVEEGVALSGPQAAGVGPQPAPQAVARWLPGPGTACTVDSAQWALCSRPQHLSGVLELGVRCADWPLGQGGQRVPSSSRVIFRQNLSPPRGVSD